MRWSRRDSLWYKQFNLLFIKLNNFCSWRVFQLNRYVNRQHKDIRLFARDINKIKSKDRWGKLFLQFKLWLTITLITLLLFGVSEMCGKKYGFYIIYFVVVNIRTFVKFIVILNVVALFYEFTISADKIHTVQLVA